MTKNKLLICICALAAVLAVLLCFLFVSRNQDKEPEATTTEPSSTAATTEATEPSSDPTGTTEEEKQMYWVFAHGGLWVRTGPGTDYVLAGSLEDGEVIEVLDWKDGWAYIEKPVKGWCSGDYIHKLGWYKDVKTPEGTPPADNSLKGKWVHVTPPVEKDGVVSCTAGIFRLRSNGTFIHRVDEYQKNAEGKWVAVNTLTDHPYWVGEYSFDGKQLVLNYMAELVETYDQQTGEPKTREWTAWIETVALDIAKAADTITAANADRIPLTLANEHDTASETTLYKASNDVGTPEDVCAVLEQYYP